MSKEKSENKGQGKAGGSLTAPENIPAKSGGAEFGTAPSIDGKVQSPKERTTSGIDTTWPGSNVSRIS